MKAPIEYLGYTFLILYTDLETKHCVLPFEAGLLWAETRETNLINIRCLYGFALLYNFIGYNFFKTS